MRIEVEYPHPPERVWRALTEPAALREWLMETDFEPELGRRFEFRDPNARGWGGVVDCEIVELEPQRRLAYTWQGDPQYPQTLVRFTLEPVDAGTRLVLEHTGFTGARGKFLWLMMRLGWGRKLRKDVPELLGRHAA